MVSPAASSMDIATARAIITGAASGLGKHFAQAILDGGGKVVITDVNVEVLNATGAEFQAKYGANRVGVVHQDVTEAGSFEAVFDFAAQCFGAPVNVLVNNAGILGSFDFFKEHMPRDWETVISVNLTAVMRGAQYGAAKAAIVSLTRSMHNLKECANVRVVSLCPGFADTPIGRLAIDAFIPGAAAAGALMTPEFIADGFKLALTDTTNAGRSLVVLEDRSFYHLGGPLLTEGEFAFANLQV